VKWLYASLYFAGVAAQVVIRWPHERASRKVPKSDRRVTPAERALLGALTVTMLLLPLLYVLSPRLKFADYRFAPACGALAAAGGAACLLASLWLFWRAHRDLGTNWSPSLEIRAGHTLVTHGVYRRVRHPMYASQLLYCMAQALLLQNWIAGPAGFVAFILMYLVRVPLEERMMLDHFGEAYRAHCHDTGRIAPRFKGLRRR